MEGGGDGELVEQAQGLYQALGLDLVPPVERPDDAPDMTAALADVLDQVHAVVAIDALDAEEHGAGLLPRGAAP
jgi:hypothetical protein